MVKNRLFVAILVGASCLHYFFDVDSFEDDTRSTLGQQLRVAKASSNIAKNQPLRMIVGGDLLLSSKNTKRRAPPSSCEQLVTSTNANASSKAWNSVLPTLQSADAVFANLETPVSDRPFAIYKHPSGFAKRAGFQVSTRTLDILKAGHISAVSLSNNHLLDIPNGVEDTVRALEDAAIPYAGAGLNVDRARDFRTIAARHHPNMKIAFLSASDLRSIRDQKSGWEEDANFVDTFRATATRPGIWDVATTDQTESLALHYNEADFATIQQQILRARQNHDLVVFCLHFQPNIAGFQAATPYKQLARKMIDAGVDVFVGQHPHHMQEFEFYKGRPMIMGAGEMLRALPGLASFHKMEVLHEIIYDIRWPVAIGQEQRVSMDLILVQTDPESCTVSIELEDLNSARERVRRINPGKTFEDIKSGLRYTSDELLSVRQE